MKHQPCEKAIWETLPIIRKEVACCMIHNYGLTQKEAAESLGITPAAVSQYRCNKRANKEIKDPLILNEIKKSTKIIINKKNGDIFAEICRLCKLINKNITCII
jgi:predicted transcriptional regulator